MKILRQSTAVSPKIGPFVDSGDGDTAETALTISQADVRLSKNHGAFAQKNEATACTHDENGWYTCPLDATDTGTLGPLKLSAHESGALFVWHEWTVVPAMIYDTLVAGTDRMDAELAATPPDAAGIRAALGLASANLDTQLTTIDDFLDTELAAILAAVDTEVAAIKAKTDLIPAAPAAVGDVPTAAVNAAGLLDLAAGVETGFTVRQVLRGLAAVMLAKSTDDGTKFRDLADSKNRVVATVNTDGERTAVTLDLT